MEVIRCGMMGLSNFFTNTCTGLKRRTRVFFVFQTGSDLQKVHDEKKDVIRILNSGDPIFSMSLTSTSTAGVSRTTEEGDRARDGHILDT